QETLRKDTGLREPEQVRDWLHLHRQQNDKALNLLLEQTDATGLVRQLVAIAPFFRALENELAPVLQGFEGLDLSALRDELDTLYYSQDNLKELLPALRQLSALSPAMQKAVRT